MPSAIEIDQLAPFRGEKRIKVKQVEASSSFNELLSGSKLISVKEKQIVEPK